MRNEAKYAAGALVVVLFPAAAFAQPLAVFPETNFDFGQVPRGSYIYRDFTIENKGAEPLIIQRLAMTRPLRAVRTVGFIRPGGQAGLRFALDTTTLSGAYDGAIQLFLNDPRLPVAQLRFAGIVQSAVEVLPRPVLAVYARRGVSAQASVEIVNRETAPISIEKIERRSERFSTKLETLEPGRRFRLTVTLKPDAAAGGRVEEILVHTSSTTTPLLRLTAQTAVFDRLSAEPDRVDFGSLSLGAVRRNPGLARGLRAIVTLHGLEDERLELAARTDLDFLKLEVLKRKRGGRLQVAISPIPEKLRPGAFRGSVYLSANLPGVPALRVRVLGTVTE
jgi:hypothetical protein